MKQRVYDILKLVFCLFIFLFIGRIFSILLYLFNVNELTEGSQIFLNFIMSLILLIIVTFVYRDKLKKDFKELKKNKKKIICYILQMFVVFMVLKYFLGFITVILTEIFKIDSEAIVSVNQETIEGFIKKAPILMFITSVILAPMYEETLFRVGFRKAFKSDLLFILLSGTLFGMLHIFPLEDGVSLTLGLIQSVSYVGMGLYFAYLYNKSDNIFCSVGIHFLNNLISILTIINMF